MRGRRSSWCRTPRAPSRPRAGKVLCRCPAPPAKERPPRPVGAGLPAPPVRYLRRRVLASPAGPSSTRAGGFRRRGRPGCCCICMTVTRWVHTRCGGGALGSTPSSPSFYRDETRARGGTRSVSGSQNPCQACPAAGLIRGAPGSQLQEAAAVPGRPRPRAWKFHSPPVDARGVWLSGRGWELPSPPDTPVCACYTSGRPAGQQPSLSQGSTSRGHYYTFLVTSLGGGLSRTALTRCLPLCLVQSGMFLILLTLVTLTCLQGQSCGRAWPAWLVRCPSDSGKIYVCVRPPRSWSVWLGVDVDHVTWVVAVGFVPTELLILSVTGPCLWGLPVSRHSH